MDISVQAKKNISCSFLHLVKFIGLIAVVVLFTGCSSALLAHDADKLASSGEWDEAALMYRGLYQKDPSNLAYKIKYNRASSRLR